MDAALQQPQYDELGLPLRESGAGIPDIEDIDDDAMEKFAAGDFSALGLPMPSSMPTRKEAQREARERSADVLSSWNMLRQILERHEEVIRKRWTKKTKAQRGKIVSGLWPNMAPSHRPDYTAFFKESQTAKGGKTKYRESCTYNLLRTLSHLSSSRFRRLNSAKRGEGSFPRSNSADFLNL